MSFWFSLFSSTLSRFHFLFRHFIIFSLPNLPISSSSVFIISKFPSSYPSNFSPPSSASFSEVLSSSSSQSLYSLQRYFLSPLVFLSLSHVIRLSLLSSDSSSNRPSLPLSSNFFSFSVPLLLSLFCYFLFPSSIFRFSSLPSHPPSSLLFSLLISLVISIFSPNTPARTLTLPPLSDFLFPSSHTSSLSLSLPNLSFLNSPHSLSDGTHSPAKEITTDDVLAVAIGTKGEVAAPDERTERLRRSKKLTTWIADFVYF